MTQRLLSTKVVRMIYGRSLFLLVAFCFVITNNAMATAMYKWVDAEGNTNYTQKRPTADTVFTSINPPSEFDSERSQKDLEKTQKYLGDSREQRQKKAEEKQRAIEDKAIQTKNCEQAKSRLATYTKPRVKLLQEDGSRVRATEEVRQAQIAESQKLITEFCK